MPGAPKYPAPVVFVPGIMGSELRDEYAVSPETVWSPFKLLLHKHDRITLHPDDTRFEVLEPARVVKDQVFGPCYSEIIEELRHNLSPQADEPVPVYPFAYDWRQPLSNIEQQLGQFLGEVIARTKLLRHYARAGYGTGRFPARVNLVGHSMGGLVIAGYLQTHGEALVDRVATIASPLRGSLEAVAKTALGVASLGVTPGSPREREMARVCPALYHLLPSFKGAVTVGDDSLSDDLFLPEAWQPGIKDSIASFIRMYGLDTTTDLRRQAGELLAAMLDAAWRHRTRVERLVLDDPKRWLCIVGVGRRTRVGMAITRSPEGPRFDLSDDHLRNDWEDADPKQRPFTGDNTVPYAGARTKFIPVEQVVCVTDRDFGLLEIEDRLLATSGLHAALPNMNLVQRLVVSHLKGKPYGDVWGRPPPDLPAGTAWDPPIAGLRAKGPGE